MSMRVITFLVWQNLAETLRKINLSHSHSRESGNLPNLAPNLLNEIPAFAGMTQLALG